MTIGLVGCDRLYLYHSLETFGAPLRISKISWDFPWTQFLILFPLVLRIHPPYNVVDANDVLLVGIFGAADDCGAGLEPGVAAVLVHQSVVASQDLPLLDH